MLTVAVTKSTGPFVLSLTSWVLARMEWLTVARDVIVPWKLLAAVASAVPATASTSTTKVRRSAPNTTFFIQRAPEVGRPLGEDGTCQRAKGLFPWEQPNSAGFPPAPAYLTFPGPLPGDLATLVTNSRGNGTVHFTFAAPTVPDGTRFDVKFRLVDSVTAPTNLLRTRCFTVEVK